MSKRIQIVLTPDAWNTVEAICTEANKNFASGTVTTSDAINEMILTAKVDIRSLQLKHTDLRRSLRVMAANEDIDVDAVLKALTEFKARSGKKKTQIATGETT